MKKFQHFFWMCITLFLVTSCDQDPECSQSTISGVKFTMEKNTRYIDVVAVDSVFNSEGVFDSIVTRDTTIALIRPTDPVWFNVDSSPEDTVYSTSFVQLQFLPFLSGQTRTLYQVHYESDIDVIEFYYKENLEFVDIPCGFIATFAMDSVKYSTTFIDSITLLSKDANTDVSTENLKIYYH